MCKIVFQSRLLDDGHLECPEHVVAELSRRNNPRLHVTVELESAESLEEELGVTEVEIQRMVELQEKSREVVLNFLRAAGSLADDEDFERQVNEVRERGNRWRTPML
jgi:hypothetical protein